ncbi:helix-turn-helix transcriptional regulator, partial [Nonomuraea zeae]
PDLDHADLSDLPPTLDLSDLDSTLDLSGLDVSLLPPNLDLSDLDRGPGPGLDLDPSLALSDLAPSPATSLRDRPEGPPAARLGDPSDVPAARLGDPSDVLAARLAATIQSRLEVMRSAVRARLARSAALDPATRAIATGLRKGRTVADVAWSLGLSERQLQRRSVTAFGYAPKTLQRIVRFQCALRLARAGVPLAEVAVTAGYTDQAHLSHDVKRLSGVSLRGLVSPVRELA